MLNIPQSIITTEWVLEGLAVCGKSTLKPNSLIESSGLKQGLAVWGKLTLEQSRQYEHNDLSGAYSMRKNDT